MFLLPQLSNPRSIFLIFGVLLLISTLGIRLLWQALIGGERASRRMEPVAIFGAGRQGRDLVSLLNLSKQGKVVLFLDDSPVLEGTTISGVPVVNPSEVDLPALLAAKEIKRLILASPKIERNRIRQLLSSLDDDELIVQTLPTVSEIVGGSANAGDLRDVAIADLLGRDEVPPDQLLLSDSVIGKVVLVTGGGGSIGSEICRQCVALHCRKLIILDSSEENLYRISEELVTPFEEGEKNKSLVGPEIKPVLGSVLDKDKVSRIISRSKIDTVFHAAAYKHVPIIEGASSEGYMTNVLGTQNVLTTAVEHDVERFVLISTDKAVRPTNVMGCTKRLAEIMLQAHAAEGSTTKISMVRFGNVLGSSGSVVPKFKKQIKEGGPITITHPDITRYFMSIPEAAQLVLQSSSLGKGGEVFVLDMGEPVKIVELAKDLIRLSGLTEQTPKNPGGGIAIEYTGLRPGEKLFEEMFIGEDYRSTQVRKIFVADENFLPLPVLEDKLGELTKLAESGHSDDLVAKIKSTVKWCDVPTEQTLDSSGNMNTSADVAGNYDSIDTTSEDGVSMEQSAALIETIH